MVKFLSFSVLVARFLLCPLKLSLTTEALAEVVAKVGSSAKISGISLCDICEK